MRQPRPRSRPAGRRARWRFALGAISLGAVLAVGACGSATRTSHTGPASVSHANTSGRTTTTTITTTSAQSTATAASAAVPACATANLRLSLASGGAAAGTAYYTYHLTNTGPTACSMSGYPGVAVLDANGRIVQHPARRGASISASVRRVTIGPGEHASFLVNSTDVVPSPGCPRQYTGSTLQVYPPNQKKSILLPDRGPFCNLRVGPVQSGGR